MLVCNRQAADKVVPKNRCASQEKSRYDYMYVMTVMREKYAKLKTQPRIIKM